MSLPRFAIAIAIAAVAAAALSGASSAERP
jgi:hypothetical protein